MRLPDAARASFDVASFLPALGLGIARSSLPTTPQTRSTAPRDRDSSFSPRIPSALESRYVLTTRYVLTRWTEAPGATAPRAVCGWSPAQLFGRLKSLSRAGPIAFSPSIQATRKQDPSTPERTPPTARRVKPPATHVAAGFAGNDLPPGPHPSRGAPVVEAFVHHADPFPRRWSPCQALDAGWCRRVWLSALCSSTEVLGQGTY
jgi:hypothetical protein